MNSDFKELLSIFNARQVKYLVVGGYAVSEYSEPRYTKDLDIWIEASLENAAKVFAALKQFKAPLSDLTTSDFAEEGNFYQMGRPPVRIDILMSVEGLKFIEAWENRQITNLFDTETNFISHDDLIRSKEAAGRPQDLLDIENLLLARRIKKNNKVWL